MTTTSLKLPEDIKRKAIAAAQEVGVTPQEFMVGAIRQAVAGAEQRAQFIADAKAARKEMLQTGVGYDAKTVHAYLRDRVANLREQASIRRFRGKLPWEGDLDAMRTDGLLGRS